MKYSKAIILHLLLPLLLIFQNISATPIPTTTTAINDSNIDDDVDDGGEQVIDNHDDEKYADNLISINDSDRHGVFIEVNQTIDVEPEFLKNSIREKKSYTDQVIMNLIVFLFRIL